MSPFLTSSWLNPEFCSSLLQHLPETRALQPFHGGNYTLTPWKLKLSKHEWLAPEILRSSIRRRFELMETFFKTIIKIQASKQNSIICLLSEVLQLLRAFRRGECSYPFCLLLSAFLCLTFLLVSWSAHVEKDNFRNTWVTPQWNRSHLSLIFHVFITTGLVWKSTKASKHHTDQQRRAREAMRAGRTLPDTSSCVQTSCKFWKVAGVRLKTEVKSVWNGWLLNASKIMTVMKMWGEWWMRAVSGEAASAAEHGAAKNEK